MAKLKIKRPRSFFSLDTWRAYRVYIDGQEVGKIGRGKEAEFTLSAGEHKIQLKIDWCGSPTLTVNLVEGQEKVLLGSCSGNGMTAIFSPNDYLSLEEQHKYKPRNANAWATIKSLFRDIPVTMTIIMLLSTIFTLEMFFNIGPLDTLSPNLRTLIAFGGLYHPAILQSGEWFRMFSSVLLHASVIHLLLNCYALLLAGIILENFIGRLWYIAAFLAGGVGGSFMALIIDPEMTVSVGASGAIMALFATALICSFHLPPSANRRRFQMSLSWILVISLLPFLGGAHGQQHIDIAGHLGGAITGGLIGGFLVFTWEHKGKPRLKKLALGLSLLFASGYVYACVPVVWHYHAFVLGSEIIPQDQVPTSDHDATKRAKDLVTQYPNDPRSHLYMAIFYANANDMVNAEKELRLGLSEGDMLKNEFQPGLNLHMQAVLAIVLLKRGDIVQAKKYAALLCKADNGDTFRQTLVKNHLCD